jgi:formiminoglutamase
MVSFSEDINLNRALLKNYSVSDKTFWTGRVDDPEDRDSYRIHQVVRLLNLRHIKSGELDHSKLNICLLGFRCDEGTRRNKGRVGAEKGPEYIRKELANMPVSFDATIRIYDAGDIFCADRDLEEAQGQLAVAVKVILDNEMFPVLLGGGHGMALGHYNGIVAHLEEKYAISGVGIINFDAHFDLRPYTDKGSSGTMFSQIAANCQRKKRKFSYLVLGIQTYANTRSLFKRADSLGVKHVLAKDFVAQNFDKIEAGIDGFIDNDKPVYLTICSDVFNAAFAPGVSATQPFGMDPETVLIFLKKIFKSKKVIGFDIAEVSPRFDHDNRTAKLMAVLIYAMINVLMENRKEYL